VITETDPPPGARSATNGAIAALECLVLDERQPGESLPSEAELATTLGVSRLTVREATRALEARGLVQISKGRRPRVLGPNGALIGDFFRIAVRRDPTALFELFEVRRALETHIATLAATRASRAAAAALRSAIEDMRHSFDDEDRFHDADIRFHESLAEATGNSMLRQLIEELAEPLRISRHYSYRGHLRRGEGLGTVIGAHQAILDRVSARDPAGAAEAMHQHLRATERDLHAALRPDPSTR
jgi:GntR family transcriptional repressor for pyruvate dehydrogenase complex